MPRGSRESPKGRTQGETSFSPVVPRRQRRSTRLRGRSISPNPALEDHIIDWVEQHKLSWDEIALHMGDGTSASSVEAWYVGKFGKTPHCPSTPHARPRTRIRSKRRPFTSDEDDLLRELRGEDKTWAQCREVLVERGFPTRATPTYIARHARIV